MPNKCFVPGSRTGYASKKNETGKIKLISLFKPPEVILFSCFYRQFKYILLHLFMQIKLFLTSNIIYIKQYKFTQINVLFIYSWVLFVTRVN